MSARPQRVRRQDTRTKIVATLGPACSDMETLRAMLRAGADVFRLNLSHGSHPKHAEVIARARRAARAEDRTIALLADLQGPKIRVGALDDPFEVSRGDELVIVARDIPGEPGRIGCTYPRLARDVEAGDPILLDDGRIELEVIATDGLEVRTRVRNSGTVRRNKGINLPGTRVSARALSRKDLADLAFVLDQGVEYVGLSFVRSASDIRKLAKRIRAAGSSAEVIAKIERPEAVEDLDAILEACDGVMVARGDLGVEMGAEAVPSIQKRIISAAIGLGKPVITATQMLESMILEPQPTRAEASDVANAIYDGSSAVMLSGETAMGKYPALTVRTMDRIARRIEEDLYGPDGQRSEGELAMAVSRRLLVRAHSGSRSSTRRSLSIPEAAVRAAARAALDVKARAVVVFTESGRTAKLVARERLPMRVIAMTDRPETGARLNLVWGVTPTIMPGARSVTAMHRWAERALVELKEARPGDRVIFIAGTVHVTGATDVVRIRTIRSPDEVPR